jgi:hypothetical protein
MSDTNEVSGFAEIMQRLEESLANTRVEGEIEFPIEVSSVDMRTSRSAFMQDTVGSWCKIRPCSEAKTYLGIYLGELMHGAMHSYNVKDKVITVIPHANPAIFVPDLKRVVWGCESWWGLVKSPDDLRQITDADIQNVWYVKAIKELSSDASVHSEAEK